MYRHLYQLLKPCPKSENNIELTEEVKQHILNNRVYHIPKQTQQQIIINQINNNQQIINYIAKIDPIQKIQAYIEYKNATLVPFEDKVREQYMDIIEKCQNLHTPLTTLALDKHALTNIINDITIPNGIDKLNVVYDKSCDRLHIYDDGEWENYPFEHGAKVLIEKIQFVYLDKYEELLLDKRDHDSTIQERKRAEERLIEYYLFLLAFEIKPFLLRSQRKEIVEYKDNFYFIYERADKATSTQQKNNTKKSVYTMIRNNSVTSVNELNKGMMDIFCSDQEFKSKVLSMLQCST